jgi:hypothetical protein
MVIQLVTDIVQSEVTLHTDEEIHHSLPKEVRILACDVRYSSDIVARSVVLRKASSDPSDTEVDKRIHVRYPRKLHEESNVWCRTRVKDLDR